MTRRSTTEVYFLEKDFFEFIGVEKIYCLSLYLWGTYLRLSSAHTQLV